MNKKTMKIAGWALGLSLAVAGIGAAIGTSAKGAVETKAADEDATIILDANALSLTSTASTAAADHTYGGVTYTVSNGAKYQAVQNTATNYFLNGDSHRAILIGKSGAYIYNKTAIPGVIKKFEIYANGGASTKVSVSVDFSATAITSAKATSDWSATLSTADHVYTVKNGASDLVSGAKYFYYKVTNANNSQVQFRITYTPTAKATSVAITKGGDSETGSVTDHAITIEKNSGTNHKLLEDLVATAGPNGAEDKTVTWSLSGTNSSFVDWANREVQEYDNSHDAEILFEIDTASVGIFTITVSADGGENVTDYITYEIVDSSAAPLTGVTVSGTPTKATQYDGNVFDPSGLIFTANHSSDPTQDAVIGSGITWDLLETGQHPQGHYTENGVTINFLVNAVTVEENALHVSISGSMTKTLYSTVESWSAAGLTASAVYSDESVYTGGISLSFDPATPAALGVGTNDLVVTATTEAGPSTNKTISVTVVNPVAFTEASTDELTYSSIGNTGTAYKAFTLAGTSSSAVYGGATSGGNTSIQLRSNSSDSGIMTTVSGGFAKKVTLEWNSNTVADRTIDVYGKNTAYESVGELYSGSTQGTKLGSIVCGTSTELEIDGFYSFVALRSKSGALNLDKVSIDWVESAANSDVLAVNNFIQNKMHLDHTSNDMSCKNEGWFTAARSAFEGLTGDQKDIILKSPSPYKTISETVWKYTDVRDRLAKWAEANNASFDKGTGVFSAAHAMTYGFSSTESTMPLVVTVAILGAAGVAGFFLFQRKRKEN